MEQRTINLLGALRACSAFLGCFFGGRPAARNELSTAEKTTIYLESVAPIHAPTSKSNKAPRRARWLALGAVGETQPRRVSACMTIAINIDSAGEVSTVTP